MEETVSTVQIGNLMLAIVVVTLAIALFATVAFYLKKFPAGQILNSRLRPTSRLAVLETIQVDRRRKLVLLSKDGQEFLMMLGGPTDVLVSGTNAILDENNVETALKMNGLLGQLDPSSDRDQNELHTNEPRTMETSTERMVVASNDEIQLGQNDQPQNTPHDLEKRLPIERAAQQVAQPRPRMPRAAFLKNERGQAPAGQWASEQTFENQTAQDSYHQHRSAPSDFNRSRVTDGHIQTNEQELQDLLDDAMSAPKIDEEVVAEAVNLLSSEEEVTAFFDRTRSRVFQQNPKRQKPREDTDDFSAVLRSQQGADVTLGSVSSPMPYPEQARPEPQRQPTTASEQIAATAPSMQQAAHLPDQSHYNRPIHQHQPTAPQSYSDQYCEPELPLTATQAKLNEHALIKAEKNAKEAASRARQNASKTMQIQPIPETPEERVAKLKALLHAHQKSHPV